LGISATKPSPVSRRKRHSWPPTTVETAAGPHLVYGTLDVPADLPRVRSWNDSAGTWSGEAQTLAAQARYAETGVFPDALLIRHLLGDPALSLRWTASEEVPEGSSPSIHFPSALR